MHMKMNMQLYQVPSSLTCMIETELLPPYTSLPPGNESHNVWHCQQKAQRYCLAATRGVKSLMKTFCFLYKLLCYSLYVLFFPAGYCVSKSCLQSFESSFILRVLIASFCLFRLNYSIIVSFAARICFHSVKRMKIKFQKMLKEGSYKA